jgi:Zn-dependent protease with chaperone function
MHNDREFILDKLAESYAQYKEAKRQKATRRAKYLPIVYGGGLGGITLAAPKYIAPKIFEGQEPLDIDKAISSKRLATDMKKAGIRLYDVTKIKSPYFAALKQQPAFALPGSRMIGYRKLKSMSPEEMDAILAHEFGHTQQKYLPLIFATPAAGAGIGAYLAWRHASKGKSQHPYIETSLGALGGTAGGVLLRNLLASRIAERGADKMAVRYTGDTMASAIDKLTNMLGKGVRRMNDTPIFTDLAGAHPTVTSRIKYVKKLARKLAQKGEILR